MLDQLIIGAHLYTAHLDPHLAGVCGDQRCTVATYNSINLGVYARTSTGWQAGAYRNSHRKPTAYAGRAWETSCWALHCGVGMFGATGYPSSAVVPMIPVSMRYQSVRLAYMPRIGDKASGLIHVSIEFGH